MLSKSIIDVPWMKSEDKAKLVKSSSSELPHLVKASGYHYKCDNNCQMFKGFSLCSHVVAVAQINGELSAFLNAPSSTFVPNLSSISQRDMPSGSGRKGGVAKRKRKQTVAPVESMSFRQSLTSAGVSKLPTVASTPVTSPSSVSVSVSTDTSCTVLGSGVVITSCNTPCTQVLPSTSCPTSMSPGQSIVNNPFILKLKSAKVRVCQTCRNNYEGSNDTMGLIAARAERRIISNVTTGTQFLAKESNSHYHVHLRCLTATQPIHSMGNILSLVKVLSLNFL